MEVAQQTARQQQRRDAEVFIMFGSEVRAVGMGQRGANRRREALRSETGQVGGETIVHVPHYSEGLP